MIAAKELATEIEKAILSARSTSVSVLRPGFNQANSGNYQMLISDRDGMVVKAMSWALRRSVPSIPRLL
jgi:hypothetical protein